MGYYRVVALRPGIGRSYSDVVAVSGGAGDGGDSGGGGLSGGQTGRFDTALKLAWNRVYTLDSRDVTVDLETLGSSDVPYALSNRARATSYEVQYVENNGEYGEYGYPATARRGGLGHRHGAELGERPGLAELVGSDRGDRIQKAARSRRTCRRW